MVFGPGNIGGSKKKLDSGFKPQNQQDLLLDWMCCARAKDISKVLGLRLEAWTDYDLKW